MMNPRRTFLKTSALLGSTVFASHLLHASDSTANAPDATSDIWDVFKHRRSVRRYEPDPVPGEHLSQILDAARMAPTSGNQQPWKFLVIREPARIQALKTACIERARRYFDPAKNSGEGARERFEDRVRQNYNNYFSAPVYIVVLTDNESRYPDYNHWDGPLAAGNLMLAARALGYGTVFITDSVPEEVTTTVLSIPARYTRVCITPLGVPVEWPEPHDKKPLESFIAYESLDEST